MIFSFNDIDLKVFTGFCMGLSCIGKYDKKLEDSMKSTRI